MKLNVALKQKIFTGIRAKVWQRQNVCLEVPCEDFDHLRLQDVQAVVHREHPGWTVCGYCETVRGGRVG